MSGTGLLDLCPCIPLALRDRKHIAENLIGMKNNIL